MFGRAIGQPMCKHGLACYRNNPSHWREYDHPADHPKLRSSSPIARSQPSAAIDLDDEPSTAIDLDDEPDDGPDVNRLIVMYKISVAEARSALKGRTFEAAAQLLADQVVARAQQTKPEPFESRLRGAMTTENLVLQAAREEAQESPPKMSDSQMAQQLQREEERSAVRTTKRPAWSDVHAHAHHKRARAFSQQRPPPRRTFDCSSTPLFLNKLSQDAAGRAGASLADLAASSTAVKAEASASSSTIAYDAAAPPEIEIGAVLWWPPFIDHALVASFGVDYKYLASLLAGSPATIKQGGIVVCDNDGGHSAGSDTASHAPWEVVTPPFYAHDASSWQRERMNMGTMHPKLWLIEFAPERGRGFLRVGIFSSNVGGYDAGINNQFWLHDFPLRSDATQAGTTSDFELDLVDFVQQLLRPSASTWEAWRDRLAKYDLTPPPGVHLVASVPGRHGTSNKYGLRALRRHLDAELNNPIWPRQIVSRVEYASSSVGKLARDVWPKIRDAMLTGAKPGTDDQRLGEANDRVRIVWPSVGTTLANMWERAPGWWREPHSQPIGPGKQWESLTDGQEWVLRKSFSHHVMPWPERARTFHHCKVAAGFDDEHDLVWLYTGSHNCSGAAWGKTESGDFVVMAYELGVLTVFPVPIIKHVAQSIVPWQTPARPYTTCRAIDAKLSGVAPYSSYELQLGRSGEGRLEEAAYADVAQATAAARDLAAAASLELPPLLPFPFGMLPKLERLKPSSTAPPQITDDLPVQVHPNNITRRSPIDLARGDGRKLQRLTFDELRMHFYDGGGVDVVPELRSSQPVTAVPRLELSMCANRCLGKPEADDPIVTFYELAADPRKLEQGTPKLAARPLVASYRCANGEQQLSIQPTLSIEVHSAQSDPRAGGPPGGLLLLLLDPHESAVAANTAVLRQLAAWKGQVARQCWGVTVLRPSDSWTSSWSPALSLRDEPAQPSHADLVALTLSVRSLPAVQLRAPDTVDPVRCWEQDDLKKLQTPLNLGDFFSEETLKHMTQMQSRKANKIERHQQMVANPLVVAENAAQWLRSQAYQLLLIEPEGALKKPCNVGLSDKAGTTNQTDSFKPGLVPLLKHLLLPPDHEVDASPAATKLRVDAPRLAFVTDFGQQVSEGRNGGAKLTEDKVRETIDGKLLDRLANECGIAPRALRAHTTIYHSFLPASAAFAPLDEADPRLHGLSPAQRGPWTKAWAKPEPGQLLQAISDAGVIKRHVLMIGRDERDSKAAQAASVDYLEYPWLGNQDMELMSRVVRPNEQRTGGLAPESFAGD